MTFIGIETFFKALWPLFLSTKFLVKLSWLLYYLTKLYKNDRLYIWTKLKYQKDPMSTNLKIKTTIWNYFKIKIHFPKFFDWNKMGNGLQNITKLVKPLIIVE